MCKNHYSLIWLILIQDIAYLLQMGSPQAGYEEFSKGFEPNRKREIF